MLKTIIIATSVFFIATVSNCLAQTRVEGQVLSPTPCHLYPKGTAEACIQITVGVPGNLVFKHLGGRAGRSIKTPVTKDGDFAVNFRQAGRYKVSFVQSSGDSDSLSISPRAITVRGRKAGQAELFVVAHKSYGKVPSASLSSGCVIE
jgi:hypothetical protein